MTPESHAPDAEAVAGTPVGHDGTNVSISEHRAWSGSTGLAVAALLGGGVVFLASIALIVWAAVGMGSGSLGEVPGGTFIGVGVVLILLSAVVLGMLRVINPGHTQVVQFFGRYLGTNRTTGLTLVPPLATSKKVSVRVRNFETNEIKVNDLNGNPVKIGAIVVWQVSDTAKATFSVEDVDEFIHSQAESALRHVATSHPYDSVPGRINADGTSGDAATSLAGSTDVVSRELADEVAARVAVAGLEIVEARISALSYAPEIAGAMLQRQQAQAVVDAREQIVDGAVSMVQTALDQLEERDIVDLDPERRASMVSNLLVVLCSDSSTQPVINTGGLHGA
ncbi:SPFH domain-containing protein [Corynebacterium sp.]|uniref:SPFH domain-containing protein n=1 Tax=Corynebacterium sp. TaxID=1720 RepID=UPI003B3AAD2B